MRDSPVCDRLCPFVVGDEAAVSEGESSSVTEVRIEVSENDR
jgi:hypothetical protein